MNREPLISIGLYTDGTPQLSLCGERWRLNNLLIGGQFHWRQRVAAIFEGDMTHIPQSKDKITLINTLPLEKYLKSVVGSEMNPESPAEFLKAHAVISRSWAMKMMQKSFHEIKGCDGKILDRKDIYINWQDAADHTDFDVCSDDHCQRYQGVQPLYCNCEDAIDKTRGLVLVDTTGNIADTRFSKCCGGVTELFSSCWQNKDFPYLRSFSDPNCNLSSLPSAEIRDRLMRTSLKKFDAATANFYRWTVKVAKKTVTDNLQSLYDINIGDFISAKTETTGPSGRIITLRITGTEGEVVIGKELVIRRLFSNSHLYSSAFEISDAGEYLILHGKGWGHGVGLCQIGAAAMAFKGATYDEILKFYYPQTKLIPFYE